MFLHNALIFKNKIADGGLGRVFDGEVEGQQRAFKVIKTSELHQTQEKETSEIAKDIISEIKQMSRFKQR